MQKILLITNLFPNSIEPNKGIFVKQEIAELSRLCELQVIAPVPWFPFKSKVFGKWSVNAGIPEKESLNGIPVYHPRWFVTPKILGAFYGFFYFFSIRTYIRKISKKFPFDVIYAQWMYPDGFASVLLGKVLKKPVVLHGLGCDINLYTKFQLRRAMIRWSVNNSYRTIVVSEALRKVLISIGVNNQRVVVVPNGVNTELFKPMNKDNCRNILKLPLGRRIVLFIGSLEEVKGVEYLLRGFHQFCSFNNGQNDLLVMIGQGSLEGKLKQIIGELRITDKVFMAGEIKHDEIPIWLNASDIFCLPSIREGMPNVLLEAMACGKYLAGTNVGGIPGLIASEETGILFPPFDAGALKDALGRAFKNVENNVPKKPSVVSWKNSAGMVNEILSSSSGILHNSLGNDK